MYKVYRKDRLATKTTFETYENARGWVRKQLRKLDPFRAHRQPTTALSFFNFRIVRVA